MAVAVSVVAEVCFWGCNVPVAAVVVSTAGGRACHRKVIVRMMVIWQGTDDEVDDGARLGLHNESINVQVHPNRPEEQSP